MEDYNIVDLSKVVEKLNETANNELLSSRDLKTIEILVVVIPIIALILAVSDKVINKMIDIKDKCKILVRKNTIKKKEAKEMEILNIDCV